MKNRMIRSLAPISIICGALGLLAGCSSEPDSHLVSAPPPGQPVNATVTTTTMSSPGVVVANPNYVTTTNGVVQGPTSTVIVTQAPPAMQQEVVLAQPSPQYVWIRGFWTWRDNQYQWMAGHWELPPSQGSA